MSTQALSEGLSGVVQWGLAKGLSGVVLRRVCTLGLAKSSSQVALREVAKSLSQVSPHCTFFWEGTAVSCVVDAPIVPRIW